MNETNQRLINLSTRARRSALPSQAEELPHGFATRVLASLGDDQSSTADDSLSQWFRCALGALPLAALAAAACVYWPGLDADAGPRELASLIVESHFLP